MTDEILKKYCSNPAVFCLEKEIENLQGQKEEISFNRFCKCFLFSQDQVEQTIN
jgi:Pyruvate/2-oxoacid:ferredoxin oxidoreductase delta subunit